MSRTAALRALPAAVAIALAGTASAAPCGTPSGHSVSVATIDERLEIGLGDGRRLRLVGVEAPRSTPQDPERPRTTRDSLLGWLTAPGTALDLELLSAVPDRWNLLPARLFASSAGGPSLSVAEALIDAGLARAEPDALPDPCFMNLLSIETRARAAKLGIWRDPAYGVLPARDRAALAAHSGEVVLVEGAVMDVGTTPTRTYLNFGAIRTVDFAVTIARQNLRKFEKAGMLPQTLSGKMLRVRGLLETQSGPLMEIADPNSVEIIGAIEAASPYSGPKTRQ